MRGRIPETRQQLAELVALGDTDDVWDRASVLTARALGASTEGRHDEALEHATEATHLIHNAFGIATEYFRVAWPLAIESAIALDRTDTAHELLTLVSAAPAHAVPPYLNGQRMRCTALLAAHADHTNDVEPGLQAAIAVFDRLGYPYWHARAQLDLAAWMTSTGKATEATALLREAEATYERLGIKTGLNEPAAR